MLISFGKNPSINQLAEAEPHFIEAGIGYCKAQWWHKFKKADGVEPLVRQERRINTPLGPTLSQAMKNAARYHSKEPSIFNQRWAPQQVALFLRLVRKPSVIRFDGGANDALLK